MWLRHVARRSTRYGKHKAAGAHDSGHSFTYSDGLLSRCMSDGVAGQAFKLKMQAIPQPRVSCWSCHSPGAKVARVWHSRSQSVLCQAHSTQTCTAEQGSATRRAMLLGLSICTAATAAIPRQAQAGVTQCNYQKAANGLQWCDTKQGEGKSPVKGASIRCRKFVWPSCAVVKCLT